MYVFIQDQLCILAEITQKEILPKQQSKKETYIQKS